LSSGSAFDDDALPLEQVREGILVREPWNLGPEVGPSASDFWYVIFSVKRALDRRPLGVISFTWPAFTGLMKKGL
jgi:hypothetical protein